MIFSNLFIFSVFVVSIITPLISDDGDFVCCCVILEMKHALDYEAVFSINGDTSIC